MGFIVLDFGSQYSWLIVRRLREIGSFAELLPCNTPFEEILGRNPEGIVLSGGPASVYDEAAPFFDERILLGKKRD